MSEDYILGTNDTGFERLKFQHSARGNVTRNFFTGLNSSKGMKCLDVEAGPEFYSFNLRELICDEGELTVLEPTEIFLNHIKLISKKNNRENNNKFFTSHIPRAVEIGIIEEVKGKNILFERKQHKLNENSIFSSPNIFDIGRRKIQIQQT